MKSSNCSRSSCAFGLSSKSTTHTSFAFSVEDEGSRTNASLRHARTTDRCGELQCATARASAPPAAPRTVHAMGTGTISGIAQDRVDRWLYGHIEGLAPPLRYELIAGGRSNLTYDVLDADGRRVVVRRPPLGEVLQSAHDMGREHRIIAALAPTAVPVPTPLGFCGDAEVTGAPFYVMERVDGLILRDAEDVPPDSGEADLCRCSRAIVDVLVELALLEPDDVALGDLGRSYGYVERQLRRWHAQFQKSRTRDI